MTTSTIPTEAEPFLAYDAMRIFGSVTDARCRAERNAATAPAELASFFAEHAASFGEMLEAHAQLERFPVAPLVAAAGSAGALARAVGVSERTVARWQSTGVLWPVADRLATRIGRHPSEVWPDQW